MTGAKARSLLSGLTTRGRHLARSARSGLALAAALALGLLGAKERALALIKSAGRGQDAPKEARLLGLALFIGGTAKSLGLIERFVRAAESSSDGQRFLNRFARAVGMGRGYRRTIQALRLEERAFDTALADRYGKSMEGFLAESGIQSRLRQSEIDGHLDLKTALLAAEIAGLTMRRMTGLAEDTTEARDPDGVSPRNVEAARWKREFERLFDAQNFSPEQARATCVTVANSAPALGLSLTKTFDDIELFALSPAAIEEASATLAQCHLAIGEALPTDDASRDFVCLLSAFDYCPQLRIYKTLLEAARILKPGGMTLLDVILTEDLSGEDLAALSDEVFPLRTVGMAAESVLRRAGDHCGLSTEWVRRPETAPGRSLILMRKGEA
jgi:Methyltransferase domain